MPDESDRPATIGSDHRKRGTQSPATAAVLADYRRALRDELAAVIRDLRADPAPKPSERATLAALAIKLARHLETGSDPPDTPATLRRHSGDTARRGQAPKLTRRDRASLEA